MQNLYAPIRAVALPAVLALVAMTAGCGGGSKGSQVAVKVNKDEVTVQQVNEQLTHLPPGVPRDQIEPATHRVLTNLVNQELFVQQALERKLDRDPDVLAALESARRNMLAQAYIQRVIAPQAKPTDKEVRDYYVQNAYLFAERKLYHLLQLAIDATPDQAKAVEAAAQKAKSLKDLAEFLRANNISFSASSGTVAAEQVPLPRLPKIAQMPTGSVAVFPASGNRIDAIEVLSSRAEPIDDKKAAPAIQQALSNLKREELVAAELKRLRDASKIEYVGDFAKYATDATPKASESAPDAAAAGATAAVSTANAAPRDEKEKASGEQNKGVAALLR
jgi:EpsD family peptidyl-prolyl cis-trans isomerase